MAIIIVLLIFRSDVDKCNTPEKKSDLVKNAESKSNSASKNRTSAQKNQLRRLQFIDFRLAWADSVSRSQLQNEFGISLQQATLDLKSYTDAAPQNLTYSVRRKRYEPSEVFKALYTTSSADQYLLQLRKHARKNFTNTNWVGEDVTAATTPTHIRAIDPRTLEIMSKAIRSKRALEITYVSISTGQTKVRKIEPHALAYDGYRWHARAYDYRRDRYLDFVLSRTSNAKLLGPAEFDAEDDSDWVQACEIILEPQDTLNDEQRAAIAFEFDMKNYELKVSTTKALLFYVLRSYGFNPRAGSADSRNTSFLNLQVKNYSEIRRLLA